MSLANSNMLSNADWALLVTSLCSLNSSTVKCSFISPSSPGEVSCERPCRTSLKVFLSMPFLAAYSTVIGLYCIVLSSSSVAGVISATYFLVFLDFWSTTFTSFFGIFTNILTKFTNFNLILTSNLSVRLVEQALVCLLRVGINRSKFDR